MAITMHTDTGPDLGASAVELVVRIPRDDIAALSQQQIALGVYRAMLNTTDSPPEEEKANG